MKHLIIFIIAIMVASSGVSHGASLGGEKKEKAETGYSHHAELGWQRPKI